MSAERSLNEINSFLDQIASQKPRKQSLKAPVKQESEDSDTEWDHLNDYRTNMSISTSSQQSNTPSTTHSHPGSELSGTTPYNPNGFMMSNNSMHSWLTHDQSMTYVQPVYDIPQYKCKDDGEGSTIWRKDEGFLQKDCIYLCGNSLGLQPKRTRELISEELHVWADRGVNGHFDHPHNRPWALIDDHVVQSTAKIVGAKESEVAVMNSLTANLHFLMVSFYRPTSTRHKILMEPKCFPSDHFAIESQIKFHGYDPLPSIITVNLRDGESNISTDDILQAIDKDGDSIALVLFGGVQYYTGQLFDMQAITRAGHEKGCVVGFDLAHAVGNVPLQLHDWNVDFAAWCTYKYLNSGAGGIGGAFVHERHASDSTLPKFLGWWGTDPTTKFAMSHDFKPINGANQYRVSNPAVLTTVALMGSLSVFDKTSMAELRAKSLLLTGYLEHLLDKLSSPYIKIITPRDPLQRGCQLSVLLQGRNMEAVHHALLQQGIVCDERKPDVIRISPAPLYNTFEDFNNQQMATCLRNSRVPRNALQIALRATGESSAALACSRTLHLNKVGTFAIQRARIQYIPVTSQDVLYRAQQKRGYASAYPPHTVVNMPALSPTMTMGNLGQWQKKIGDQISPGDVLVEIETDKAQMDFECQDEGFLAKILIAGGEKDVPVNKAIAVLVENKSDIEKFATYTPEAGPSTEPPKSPPSGQPESSSPPPPAPEAPSSPPPAAAAAPAPSTAPATPPSDPFKVSDRVMASPAAKIIAASRGISLEKVIGTGPGGRILKSDVESYVPAVAPAPTQAATPAAPAAASAPPKATLPPPTPAPGASFVDIPLTNVRKVIASRLQQSKQFIPHYYETMEVKVDEVLKLREKLNGGADGKFKLSINDFVVKAASLALKDVPDVNSSWQDTYIRRFVSSDIAVAVATDNGLITPIIPAAETKGLSTISNSMKELATRARANKLAPHEYQGGTFTISNLGMYGIHDFTAIINPPHAAILAVGASDKKVIPDETSEKGFAVVNVMYVTLSSDHRVVDGAVSAQWLQKFKSYLEKPMTMLL
ncbi:hypothetical protein SmJEL517_g03079 [Synchytrium microbalum]|uniref:Kynureninase n=1 Tax=Synchytrium microbalum TaxID=1806994 RepID=A0A507C469_9FUNG|nr:uncharacterized protein SmJEL517_g03079 [Synchytrium microbalum]TPX34178.1 hypothetical protein SmJEL517_g03079 [Synchytrium microbalum]